MMIEMRDVLKLIGGELRDESDQSIRFREFIEQDKWEIDQIKRWLDECINSSSGAHDPLNRAFQDILVSLGKRLGFEIEYGRYVGKSGHDNFDGIWRKENGDTIVLEAKTSTWPIGSVGQLGNYIDGLQKNENIKNIYGLYVIGKGDIKPLTEQIIGSKYKEKMRLILYEDLIEILNLKEELEPAVGEENSIAKIQNILLPIESINIGNLVRLILEIATVKSTEKEETAEEKVKVDEIDEKQEEPWTKVELIPYLRESTPHQRILLAALSQVDKEPALKKTVLFLMNEIAKRRKLEGIDKKPTGRQIAGARGGMTRRRKHNNKEDIIDASWGRLERDYIFKIKDDYKQIITDWVKSENLWIKDEIG